MGVRLHSLAFWGGLTTVLASMAFALPAFDFGKKREWNRCKQERRAATLNHDYSTSEHCRDLLGQSNKSILLIIGGFALLVVARKTKGKKAD